MFCSECGAAVGPGWKHCSTCGAAVGAPAPTGFTGQPQPSYSQPTYTPQPPAAPPPSYPQPASTPPPSYPPPSYEPHPTYAPPPIPGRYRSIRGLTIALTWLLGVGIVVTLAMAGTYANRRNLLADSRDGNFATVTEARSADRGVNTAVGWGLIIGLAIFVLLIILLWRASKNTELWTTQKRSWSPGWTIGGWFIPLASLVIPFLVVREIWLRSPTSALGEGRRHAAPLWPVACWWAAWSVGNLMLFSVSASNDSSSLDTLIRLDSWRTIAALCFAGGAALLIVVVRGINTRQSKLSGVDPRAFAPPGPQPMFPA